MRIFHQIFYVCICLVVLEFDSIALFYLHVDFVLSDKTKHRKNPKNAKKISVQKRRIAK